MKKKAKIYYYALDDFWRKEQKLEWLKENKLKSIAFETITPDEKNNWINLADTDFEDLIPLVDKKSDESIFHFYSMGVVTARDEWVYDFSKSNLSKKMLEMNKVYNECVQGKLKIDNSIKWSSTLENYRKANVKTEFDENKIVKAFYRPFIYKYFYSEKVFNDRLTSNHKEIFASNYNSQNHCIGNIGKDTVIPFSVLAFDSINDLNSLSNAAGGTKTFPFYTYDAEGNRRENITDWALEKFRQHYREVKRKNDENLRCDLSPIVDIRKQHIFHYVYAVLHDPAYRTKYELNLKRDFPRIPLYDDFNKWTRWGAELMDLHINYEQAEKYSLERSDVINEGEIRPFAEYFDESESANKNLPKPKLKADKENGIIYIDSQTTLSGIPEIAWEYKLGNRSALEWILDQYKEKKPKDATIAEKFNTYKFADYKEQVIELLQRVCTVSVKTMEIIGKMNDKRV